MNDVSLPKRIMIPVVAPACFAILMLIATYVIGGLIVAALVVAVTGRSEAADGILHYLLGNPYE